MPIADDSRTARIAGLEIDDTYTEGLRIRCADIGHGDVAGALQKLRNVINPAVARAGKHGGGQYTVESTQSLIGGDHVLAVVAVTRWS